MYSILVLCTGNNCRSQMLEGLIRYMSNNSVRVDSAGVRPGTLDPHAVAVMKDIGIDISGQHPKSAEEFTDRSFDLVVTVCDTAREQCPFFPGQLTYLHWPVPDPLEEEGTEEEIRRRVCEVRDELIDHVRNDLVWRIGDESWRTNLLGDDGA